MGVVRRGRLGEEEREVFSLGMLDFQFCVPCDSLVIKSKVMCNGYESVDSCKNENINVRNFNWELGKIPSQLYLELLDYNKSS